MKTNQRKTASPPTPKNQGSRALFRPVGHPLQPTESQEAARPGSEGAPDAGIEVNSSVSECLHGLEAGDEIVVLTWFHQADRSVLKVHPPSDSRRRLRVYGRRDRQTALIRSVYIE